MCVCMCVCMCACMLDKVLGNIGAYAGIKLRRDDDSIDRLSHHFTVVILIIFTVIVSTQQYVGDRIQCWCPAQFTEAHVAYTNHFCWVSNTYHIPFEEIIPVHDEPKKETMITYYQWVPMILLFMALMFKMPRLIWKTMTSTAAFSLDDLCTMLFGIQLCKKDERDEKMADVIDYLHNYFQTATLYSKGYCYSLRMKVARYSCFICGRRYGNFFFTSAILVKCLYVTNAIAQFFLLNDFLGAEFSLYGFEVLNGMLAEDNTHVTHSPRFPRVTLCDFKIRQLQNIHQYTVQCVLPVNLFNEKIFIFIWFWFLFVACVSGYGLVITLYNSLVPPRKIHFIKKHLKLRKMYATDKDNPRQSRADKSLMKQFEADYLKVDGVFILHVVCKNASDIVAGDLIAGLWAKFQECKKNDANGEGYL
ncbi:hypothetical protein ACJMK2_014323 [Sinanodonta woodiana]|uniref:Innexin n=1 Tax=Sinanodonta woodiana TaxID=1069815 RepID=A0ABD3V389_SINWO